MKVGGWETGAACSHQKLDWEGEERQSWSGASGSVECLFGYVTTERDN